MTWLKKCMKTWIHLIRKSRNTKQIEALKRDIFELILIYIKLIYLNRSVIMIRERQELRVIKISHTLIYIS